MFVSLKALLFLIRIREVDLSRRGLFTQFASLKALLFLIGHVEFDYRGDDCVSVRFAEGSFNA